MANHHTTQDTGDTPVRAVVPADIGQSDRIAFGLTFRQLAIIGGTGLTGFGVYRRYGDLLPPMVWLILAAITFPVAVVIALGRRDGLSLDVWLRHGLTLSRSPKTLTPGHTRGTTTVALAGKPVLPAPLRLPVTALTAAGVLTTAGVARRVIACSGTNIHLRTGQEQAALLDGFARFLNGLTGPAQILVTTQRHDLNPYAQAVEDGAARLPHPALQQAAAGYTQFLRDLDTTREPLRRQVLIVVSGDHSADAAVRALTGLGVQAQLLDGGQLAAALAAAADPFTPIAPGPKALPGAPITMRSTP
jgi:PrgI family protein